MIDTESLLAAQVAAWLQVVDGSPDAKAVTVVAPAVEVWVDKLPSIGRDEEGRWDAAARLGAIMLAARLVRRRNSPAGIEAWTGDQAAYVRNNDPDVATMLGLAVVKPKIG